jgi:multiple sugar transport system permease protein
MIRFSQAAAGRVLGTARLERRRWGPARRVARSTAAHAALVVVGVLFGLPVLWLISSSLKTSREIFIFPPQWIPSIWDWSNYESVFEAVPFLQYVLNTFIIAGSVMVGTVASCSVIAYAFARLTWRGREVAFLGVLSTMMLPFQVTMIPLYLLFHRLGWVGTFLPLIVPAFFGNPFFIFLLRQFFRTIPSEISDAAKADGCTEFAVFWRIVLPLSKPALATTALLSFIWTYTDYLGPLIYLTKQSTYTLSLGLADFVGMEEQQWGLLMAASTLTLIPVAILYFCAQKTFISGIQTTGMRG